VQDATVTDPNIPEARVPMVTPNDPAVVPPDEKDWTWVLERACPECGFDATSVAPTDVAGLLRSNAAAWGAVLAGDDSTIRRRPAPAVWSPLEYACHVRDVYVLFLERLELMLTVDGPRYSNWDQDETAVTSRYHESDPATVASELQAAASAFVDRFETVAATDWDRTGYRSDGATFTVTTFARYFIHDPIHHLHDVGVTPSA
jgi:hypothetical protein